MLKMKNRLAINGGEKIINSKLSEYKTIGINEQKAVKRVLKNKILSKFLANSKADFKGNNFLGGPEVLAFENKIKKLFNVKYAVSVNSLMSDDWPKISTAMMAFVFLVIFFSTSAGSMQ